MSMISISIFKFELVLNLSSKNTKFQNIFNLASKLRLLNRKINLSVLKWSGAPAPSFTT